MKLLIIGNGGREHAIAWKCSQSEKIEKIFVAPGNAGTALEKKVYNVNIDILDLEGLVNFVKSQKIDLTIVGPEIPLAAGIVNVFENHGLLCFGPKKEAAMLETSKVFCKKFLNKYQIPTASYGCFDNRDMAIDYVTKQNFPIVIKASGLAAGKGVFIVQNLQEAKEALIDIFDKNIFGESGSEVVIEEFLVGEELSFIVITDGKTILPFESSRDHKRRDDGDFGPNTGGMGAYSPSPILSQSLEKKIISTIIEPTIQSLKSEGITYKGFLYAGLMISKTGEAKVLEYNCRLGDPETQPLMFRLKSDLVELIMKAVKGELDTAQELTWHEGSSTGIIMASEGYPVSSKKGDAITGLSDHFPVECKVFHSGTKMESGTIVTSGGRVLCVTALGKDLKESSKRAYNALKTVNFRGCFYRKDIGI